MGVLMRIIEYIIIFFCGYTFGQHTGFIDGVESIEYDRVMANQRLQQCLRILRHD